LINLRYSGIFAATAFFFSLLIGLISRSTMPMLIIRPLIFAVLFFAITTFGNLLISRFLPELLENRVSDEDTFKPGSKINILEDDSQPYSPVVPDGFISASGQASAGAMPDDSDGDLGDISELSKKIAFPPDSEGAIPGIDQDAKESYTDEGGLSDSAGPDFSNMFGMEASASTHEKAAGTGANASVSTKAKANAGAKTGGGFNSDENLPDLDSMAGAFMTESSDQGSEESEYSGPVPPRKSSSDKTPKWTEDFDAKEIAMGIRSVLKKDKEG